jgi:hypothetical protein
MLSTRYNRIRAKPTGRGNDATKEMRAVWDDMVKNVESWSDFDVQSSLEAADDPGKRLLAYAYIFAHPDQEFINVLRRAVLARLSRVS